MKYLFPVLVTALFGMALTPAAEIKQKSTDPEQVDTVKNQQIKNQVDEEQQREEVDESDMINEFGHEIEMDNGNGMTTNRRINWPEP